MKKILLQKNISFLFFNNILKKGFFLYLFFVLFLTKADAQIIFNENFGKTTVSQTSPYVPSGSYTFVSPTGTVNDGAGILGKFNNHSVHLEKNSCYRLNFAAHIVVASSTITFEALDVTSGALLNTHTFPWIGTEDNYWTEFSYDFKIPAGCSSSDVKIVLRISDHIGNDYYIDDFSVEKLETCTATNITCPEGTSPPDNDNDGVLDSSDLDDDNDGVLDTDECNSSQRITNTSFTDEGNGVNTSSVSNWTLSGGTLYADNNGIQFENNNTSQTFSQNITNFYSDVNGKKIINVSFISMTESPVLKSDNIQFTIGYNGFDYARIETVREATSTSSTTATITYLNGATGNLVSPIRHDNRTGVSEPIQNLQLSIPVDTPSSGAVSFFFDAHLTGNPTDNINDDDLLLVSVSVNSCTDFDDDGIPNYLDLDSDGDGCSDANEYYNSSTADGGDGGVYGAGVPTVDATGKVIDPVAAPYTGTYTNAISVGAASILNSSTPADQTTNAGENATFATTVTTAGSGTTQHQWQISTDNATTWTNITNGAPYSGVTTGTLIVTGATAGMNGYKYRDLVSQSNRICAVESRIATMVVHNDILAANDGLATVDGINGSLEFINILDNDLLNGIPINPADVNVNIPMLSPYFEFNSDGTVSVKPNTPGGEYTFAYQICEKADLLNCSTATLNVFVEVPAIAIIKTATFNDTDNSDYANAGETITYNFKVTNTGNVPLSGITITDPLPGVVVSGQPISLGVNEFDEHTFSATYTILQTDINKGNISNQATVTGSSAIGITVEDKSDKENNLENNPTVIDIEGCAIKVFNAVSPNVDGDNDEFYIRGIECYPDNTVEIYNRWGVLVFEKNHYDNTNNAFKGVSEGRTTIKQSEGLPDGTYFYILKYKDSAAREHESSGYLYLSK